MESSTMSVAVPQMDAAEFQERVVEAAARQMLRSLTEGPEGEQGEVPTPLGRRIEEMIETTIREEAAAAAPKVAEEILAEGVRRRDAFGSARGEAVPLRTIVAEEATKQLARSNGRHLGQENVLEKLIRSEVASELRKELKGTLDEAKKTVAEAVREEAAKLLAESMKRAATRAGLEIR